MSDDLRCSSLKGEIAETSTASTSNEIRNHGNSMKKTENYLMLANEKKMVDNKPVRNVTDSKKQAFSGPLVLSEREKTSERFEFLNEY
jgi:hypothetical protein